MEWGHQDETQEMRPHKMGAAQLPSYSTSSLQWSLRETTALPKTVIHVYNLKLQFYKTRRNTSD